MIGVQLIRIQLPLILLNFSNSLNTSGGIKIELFVAKKTKTPNGIESNEITPLLNTDIGLSLYQIIINRNTRLVVSLNKRGCIEEYI